MTVRSVYEIDMKDEGFKRFIAMFEKYQAALKKMPGAWQAQETVAKATSNSFVDMTAALLAQQELLRKTTQEKRQQLTLTEKIAQSTTRAATATAGMARNILSATTSLIKWTGITGAIAGLAGAGGIYGLDRLAGGVLNSQRGAQGLGVSIGQQKAFAASYSPVLDDPNSFLSNINQIIHDQTKQYGLGADAAAMARRGQSTAEIAAALLPQIRQQFIRGGRTEQGMQAYGLQNFGDLQMMNVLGANSPEQMNQMHQRYMANAKTLEIDPDTRQKWIDFKVQLTTAGQQIENTFVRHLAPLAPSLTKLSDVVVKVADKWLIKLQPMIDHFADYLGSDAFETDVKSFAGAVEDMGKAAVDLAHWLGIGTTTKTEPGKPIIKIPGVLDLHDSGRHDPISDWIRRQLGMSVNGVPASTLGAIANTESGGNPNAINKRSGAQGMFQFMPKTAAQYGLGNPFDPVAATKAAGHYIADLLKEFGGDMAKALAAYNWGQGNVEKTVKQYGSNWRQHIPGETSRYIIKVENQTGGSAIVSGLQAAQ